jgi:hypothetical protein
MPRKRIKPRVEGTPPAIHRTELTEQQRKAIAECGLPLPARAAVETLALQMLLDAKANVPKKSETKAALRKLLPRVAAVHAEICAFNRWDLSFIDLEYAALPAFAGASFVPSLTKRVKNDLRLMQEAMGNALVSLNNPNVQQIENDPASLLRFIFEAFDLPFSRSKVRPDAVGTLHRLLNFVGPSSQSIADNMVRAAMKKPQTDYGGVFVGPMMQRIRSW